MKLSKAQEKAMVELRNLRARSMCKSFIAAERWKDSWVKNYTTEGVNIATLKALDKKGVIKLNIQNSCKTGVFNPVADSWGYSTFSQTFIVTLL